MDYEFGYTASFPTALIVQLARFLGLVENKSRP
jgi:hypothetical protein